MDLKATLSQVVNHYASERPATAPQPGTTVQFRDMYQSNPVFIRVG